MKQPDQHSGPNVKQLLELGFSVALRVEPLDDPVPSEQGLLVSQVTLRATPPSAVEEFCERLAREQVDA